MNHSDHKGYFDNIKIGKELVKKYEKYFQYRASQSFFYFRSKNRNNWESGAKLIYVCLNTAMRKTLVESDCDVLSVSFIERHGLLSKLGANKESVEKFIKGFKIPNNRSFTLESGKYTLLSRSDNNVYEITNLEVGRGKKLSVKGLNYMAKCQMRKNSPLEVSKIYL